MIKTLKRISLDLIEVLLRHPFCLLPFFFYYYTGARAIGLGDTALLLGDMHECIITTSVNNHNITIITGWLFSFLPFGSLEFRGTLVIHHEREFFPGIRIDPVHAAPQLDPLAFATKELHVQIETKGEVTRGETVPDLANLLGKEPNAKVCMSVDEQRVLELFYQTFVANTERLSA